MELTELQEYLREKLHEVVKRKGNLSDPEVLAVSQQLDPVLLQAQLELSMPSKSRTDTMMVAEMA